MNRKDVWWHRGGMIVNLEKIGKREMSSQTHAEPHSHDLLRLCVAHQQQETRILPLNMLSLAAFSARSLVSKNGLRESSSQRRQLMIFSDAVASNDL
jgi:hypothetical protein